MTHPNPIPPRPGATDIVWQWISYALWGWTLVALSVFLSATLSYFLIKQSMAHEVSAYSFAAVLILLPMAFFVDRAYRRRELPEKHGFAAVVLVLHAVLVFLAMVGGVLTAAVSLFWLLINGDASPTAATSIISSLVVTVLGALLFVRIVRFPRIERLVAFFPLAVIAVAVITAGFAAAGPVRSLVSTRNDRLIEDNLHVIDTAIQNYASDKNKLPQSLKDLSLKDSYQEGAKKLVSRNMVAYTPSADSNAYYMSYELCVTFSRAKGSGNTSHNDIYSAGMDHGKGKQCYDLNAYGTGSTPDYPVNYDNYLQ